MNQLVRSFTMAALLAGVRGPACADEPWSCRSGSPAPGRGAQAMGYDHARRLAIMFGGSNNVDAPFDDTWAWDGNAWTPTALIGDRPEGRTNAGMAFDFASGRLVMAGGARTGGVNVRELWAFDGASWTRLDDPPFARSGFGIDSEPYLARIVVWGGSSSGPDDPRSTWEWDGQTWELATVEGPTPRVQPGFAAMGAGQFLMFGGTDGVSHSHDETWIYDSHERAWTQLHPVHSPPARGGGVMVYESDTDRVLLFAGDDFSPDLNDTWEYSSGDWRRVPSLNPPRPRSNFAGAYDPIRRQAVFFGGRVFGDYHTSETCLFTPVPACLADVNGDGAVNVFDFLEFQNLFSAGCS